MVLNFWGRTQVFPVERRGLLFLFSFSFLPPSDFVVTILARYCQLFDDGYTYRVLLSLSLSVHITLPKVEFHRWKSNLTNVTNLIGRQLL